jgi:hypothetical protein
MKPSRKPVLFALAALLLIAAYLAFNRGPGGGSSPQASSPSSAGSEASSNSGPAPAPSPSSPWTTLPATSPAEVAAADESLRKEGARTDATLSTFPTRAYRRPPPASEPPAGAPPGEASIHVPGSGLRVSLQPNQIGEFPEVPTRLSETIGVRLSLPDVTPGTPVRVVLMDGGTFPSEEGVSRVLEAANWGGVAFEITTSANFGNHRVLVQAPGQRSRILDFNAQPKT